jgi:lipopolysaccharide export LptBFGC system permease protein LptF
VVMMMMMMMMMMSFGRLPSSSQKSLFKFIMSGTKAFFYHTADRICEDFTF